MIRLSRNGLVLGALLALLLSASERPAGAGVVACCVCTECAGANVCAVMDLSSCKNFCDTSGCDADDNAPTCSVSAGCPAVASPAAPLLGPGGLAALSLLLAGLGAAAIGWRRTRSA